MRELRNSEIGIILGALLGLLLLGLSYVFDYKYHLKTCLNFIIQPELCIRNISTIPFILAITGGITGWLISKAQQP
jgi:hypothetical protein